MIVSWDHTGALLLARETGQGQRLTPLEMVDGVPQWDGDPLLTVAPRMVVLPMELLLLRSVVLPLSHPRFIDSAILGQELEEQAGVDADAWWLAWQMERLDEGCSGLLFAMPLAMQQQLASHRLWSQAPLVTVDGWVRLQAWLTSDVVADDGVVAVVDADAEGLFLGVWRGGCWLGMRRLNWPKTGQEEIDYRVVVAQVVRSWQAMGWVDGVVVGRIHEPLQEALTDGAGVPWSGQVDLSLPARLDANVDAARRGAPALDFRHGRWAAATVGLGEWRQWRRSAGLLVLLCLVWYGQQQLAIDALQRHSAQAESDIAQAFHRGLPDQAVMLDPLGQLQVAAQGVGVGVDRQQLLRLLSAVAAVHGKVDWSLRSLQVEEGVVRLRGRVADLETLNKVHALLQRKVGRSVTIEDTDLHKQSVGFRMRWS